MQLGPALDRATSPEQGTASRRGSVRARHETCAAHLHRTAAGRDVRPAARRRAARRGARLRRVLPLRPLPAHRRGRSRPGLDRRVDDARRDRTRDVAHPARHARHTGDVPVPGPARDPGRAGRRDERRPRRARARRRVVRRRARVVRDPVPGDGRALRDARRAARDRHRPVVDARRANVLVRRPAPLGRRLPRAAEAGATAATRRSSSAAWGTKRTPRLAAHVRRRVQHAVRAGVVLPRGLRPRARARARRSAATRRRCATRSRPSCARSDER